jgi:hypothetical protein
MPKFIITTDDGKQRISPDDPDDMLDFPDAEAAIKEAQVALAEIAHDSMPDGKAARFTVEAADEAGKVIYRATLDFAAWSEGQLDGKTKDGSADVAEQLDMGPRE